MTRTRLPLKENPVRTARESIHKTLQQAASGADVHWQLWYLTECGCYARIPPKIEHYLRRKQVWSEEVEDGYRLYQLYCRDAFGKHYFTEGFELPQPSLAQHPVVAFIEQCKLSRSQFAKQLCVQPAVLYKTVENASRHLPRQLIDALTEASLPVELLEELQIRMEEYYEKWH